MTPSRMDSHTWDTSLDPAIAPVFLHLQWAQTESINVMRPVLRKRGLSLAEFDVLATLRNAPAPHRMMPTAIQTQVVITSGGLSKIMRQLQSRALVIRSQEEGDLRVKPVQLTEEGRNLIEATMQEVVMVSGQWVRGRLAPPEIAHLGHLLSKLTT